MVKRRQREAKFKEVSPTTSARPSWAISSTPYEIYRRFRSSRGIRIPPQPPVTTGARGRCGRPRATCTSPLRRLATQHRGAIQGCPTPSEVPPKRSGANLARAELHSMPAHPIWKDQTYPEPRGLDGRRNRSGKLLFRCGRPANRRLLTSLKPLFGRFRKILGTFPMGDVGADPPFYPHWMAAGATGGAPDGPRSPLSRL